MKSTQAIRALGALAQETRLAAFRLLVRAGPEGLPVGRIAEALDVALPTLSFHLKELTHAGLIRSQAVSRFVIYRANYPEMNALLGFLTENCCCDTPAAAGTASACRDDACIPPTERTPS